MLEETKLYLKRRIHKRLESLKDTFKHAGNRAEGLCQDYRADVERLEALVAHRRRDAKTRHAAHNQEAGQAYLNSAQESRSRERRRRPHRRGSRGSRSARQDNDFAYAQANSSHAAAHAEEEIYPDESASLESIPLASSAHVPRSAYFNADGRAAVVDGDSGTTEARVTTPIPEAPRKGVPQRAASGQMPTAEASKRYEGLTAAQERESKEGKNHESTRHVGTR